MPARTLIARILPVAAIAAGLLVAAPAADAKSKKKDKPVIAKIALGDKRVKKAHASAKKPKAKTSQTLAAVPEHRRAADRRTTSTLVRAAILCLHNQIRAQNNLPLLKDNAKLRKAATGHSSAMVGEGYFDHTSPDGDSFVDRIIGAGYAKRNDGWTLGENLAWGTGDLSSATGRHGRLDELRRPQGQHPQEGVPGSRHRHQARRPERRGRRRHDHGGFRRQALGGSRF